MIKLDVEDYCQECPYFCPTAKTIWSNGVPVETNVTCEDTEKCFELREKWKHEKKKEKLR